MPRFIGAEGVVFTKRYLEALPFADRDENGKVKQRFVWDAKDRGLGLLIGLGRKSFVIQRTVNGHTVRSSICGGTLVLVKQTGDRPHALQSG